MFLYFDLYTLTVEMDLQSYQMIYKQSIDIEIQVPGKPSALFLRQ